MNRISSTFLIVAACAAPVAAVADSAIFTDRKQDYTTLVTANTISADTNGTLAIYAVRQGAIGNLLGTKPIAAGVHTDVRVPIKSTVAPQLSMVLYSGGGVGGAVIAERLISKK